MPELPDVETFRKYLDATALHQRVVDVSVREKRILRDLSPRKLVHAMKGRCFETADRHGKHLFVRMNKTSVLVLHFGMTGSLDYGKARKPGKHDRIVFHFANGYSLAYHCRRLLGRVILAESPAQFVRDNNLGPDALKIGQEEFVETLRGARAAVKSCLMDQKRLAGIGNIYSDEILFQNRMSPKRKGDALSGTEATQLYRTMGRVLTTAIERRADPAEIPTSWLLPHRDEGEPCPRCRGEIRKVKIAGRSGYWCPHCQAG